MSTPDGRRETWGKALYTAACCTRARGFYCRGIAVQRVYQLVVAARRQGPRGWQLVPTSRHVAAVVTDVVGRRLPGDEKRGTRNTGRTGQERRRGGYVTLRN